MPRRTAAPKNIIAILGLIAVFFAALEHEDLIFQRAAMQDDAASLNASAAPPDSLPASFSALVGDSGTEGTFWWQASPFWLGPALAAAALLRFDRARRPLKPVWWWRAGKRRQVRPFATGDLVLRL